MKKTLFIFLALFIGINACKKTDLGDEFLAKEETTDKNDTTDSNNNSPVDTTKSNNDTSQNTPKGTLLFHLHTYIENVEVDGYGYTYTTDAGRQISLSMAQMYITNIRLVKADGSEYSVSGVKLLKTLETETYSAGLVPVGNYKKIKFKVGLSASDNSAEPTSEILKRSEMWFGNTAQPDGFVFFNVQGKIDTTSDYSGTPVNFSYKIGTNVNYVEVELPQQNFSILENQSEYAHLMIDYNRMFSGITLNNSVNLTVKTTSDNSNSTAQKIVSNIPKMFIYE